MSIKLPKILIALILILMAALFPFEAKAVAPWLIYLGISAGIPLLLGTLKALFSITAFITIVGAVHSLTGKLITSGINFQNALLDPEKITVIQTIWELLRDFVNIFFILILLIIAFATIFNIKNYKASDLLPKLIIAALLINFSLVIAVWVIDLLWIPATVFLRPMGPDIGGQIANVLNIQKFFDPGFIASTFSLGVSEIVEWIFRGVLFVVEAFIFSWIALIIWARIPILIGLMIISPIAWLGLTLPAIRKQSWDAWWSKLFCWGAIPIPLFGLIYFVTLFNQRLNAEITQAIPASVLNTVLSFIGFKTSQAIVWIITVGLFLGGLMYIKGLSCSLYSWVTLGFGKTWGGIRRGVGAGVDFGYAATGAAGAAGAIQKRILEEKGLFGGGGALGRQAREGRIEERLARWAGLRPTYATQRITEEQSEKAKRDIENELKQAKSTTEENVIIEKLRATAEEGAKKGTKDPETLAAIKVLAKKGQLDVDLFNKAVENFKDMPLTLTSVLNEWKEGKFGGIAAPDLLKILRDERVPLDAKRTGYNFIASEDGKKVAEQIKTVDEWAKMYEVLGRRMTKSGREAKKFISEVNPLVVAKYSIRDDETLKQEFDKPEDYPKNLTDAVLKQIEKTDSKNFAKYSKDVWKDDDFKKALIKMMVNKQKRDPRTAAKFAQETRKWLIRENKDDELEAFNKAAATTGVEYLS